MDNFWFGRFLQLILIALLGMSVLLGMFSLAPYILIPGILIYLFIRIKQSKQDGIGKNKKGISGISYELNKDWLNVVIKKLNNLINEELKLANLERAFSNSEYTDTNINIFADTLYSNFEDRIDSDNMPNELQARKKDDLVSYFIENESMWDIVAKKKYKIKTQEDLLKKLNNQNLEIVVNFNE